MKNLNGAVKTSRVMNAVAAGTSAQTSSAVNMAGFNGCRFIAGFGAITSGAETSIKVQQSSDDGSTDAYSDLEGTSITVADDHDNKIAIVDIPKPGKQYLKLVVSRATQNAVIDFVLAEQYGATAMPITDSTTVLGSEIHASPAEGTA